jgi:hypothetical protein
MAATLGAVSVSDWNCPVKGDEPFNQRQGCSNLAGSNHAGAAGDDETASPVGIYIDADDGLALLRQERHQVPRFQNRRADRRNDDSKCVEVEPPVPSQGNPPTMAQGRIAQVVVAPQELLGGLEEIAGDQGVRHWHARCLSASAGCEFGALIRRMRGGKSHLLRLEGSELEAAGSAANDAVASP